MSFLKFYALHTAFINRYTTIDVSMHQYVLQYIDASEYCPISNGYTTISPYSTASDLFPRILGGSASGRSYVPDHDLLLFCPYVLKVHECSYV